MSQRVKSITFGTAQHLTHGNVISPPNGVGIVYTLHYMYIAYTVYSMLIKCFVSVTECDMATLGHISEADINGKKNKRIFLLQETWAQQISGDTPAVIWTL